MKFLRITENGIYEFDSSFGLEKEDVINIAKTAIEQGLIDPRDYLLKDSKLSETLKEVIVRRDLAKEEGKPFINNILDKCLFEISPTCEKMIAEIQHTNFKDPFYCMKSKATNFFKVLKDYYRGESFDSDDVNLRHMIQKYYFPRWSDSLKILKERGYATYEKNEKGRIVNIRLLF